MIRRPRTRRPLLAVALAAAASATAAPAAAAHIQVRPAHAAPRDAVLWTVLAPSERGSGTREVELAIPTGMLPFSFEDVAGWTRRLRTNADGSVRSIVWRGRTAPDGLVTFRFLASTPQHEGAITWKAIQTYRDGATVRWIGPADSEHPAATTVVSTSISREGAGGEGLDDSEAAPAAPIAVAHDGDRDWLARGLGLAALLAATALAVMTGYGHHARKSVGRAGGRR